MINTQYLITPIVFADPIDDSEFIEGDFNYWLNECMTRIREIRLADPSAFIKAKAHVSPDIYEKMMNVSYSFQDLPYNFLQCDYENENFLFFVDSKMSENTIRIG